MSWSTAGLASSTLLASAVEFVEAFTIVLAMGLTRGWRSAIAGTVAALVLLAGVAAFSGYALVNWFPESLLQFIVGSLLLVFGLQWLRKGVLRIAAGGWAIGQGEEHVDDGDVPPDRFDWTGFVLSFKGVSLEGLEVAIIVVAVGGAAGALGSAVVGAAAAVVVLAAVGALTYRWIARIPRRALQLFVGALLSAFGTFWAGQGIGVEWPGDEASLPVLIALYAGAGVGLLSLVRGWRRAAAVESR
jgi:uncharacterized membrane protein